MGRAVPTNGHAGGVDLAASDPQRLLLGLLRLQAIVLANPEPITGLRAMVDLIYESPGVTRVSVGVPLGTSGRIRCLAQAGDAHPLHEQAVVDATPIAAHPTGTLQVACTICADGVPHTCIHVPILGADTVLGFLGVGIVGIGPIQDWREQAIWVTADLMALLLLGWNGPASTGPSRSGALDGLTPRQQQVLFELVERGDGNAAIGDRLQLSALTVKIHLLAAYRKLGVRSRAEAIRTVLTEHGGWLARQRWLRGRPAGGR